MRIHNERAMFYVPFLQTIVPLLQAGYMKL